MNHLLDLSLVAADFIAGAVFRHKVGDWGGKLIDYLTHKYLDPLFQRYIIKNERRLAIYLHHKYGHFGRNALICEVGGCAKVKPHVVHYDTELPK